MLMLMLMLKLMPKLVLKPLRLLPSRVFTDSVWAKRDDASAEWAPRERRRRRPQRTAGWDMDPWPSHASWKQLR
jgi:hypothetical protein